MKKLAKAQMGKIVKSVGNTLLKKRPVKQVFGTAGAIAGGTAVTAGVLANKAKKEFAEKEKSPEGVAQKKKYEALKKEYTKTSSKKMGGSTKSKKK
jgi:hypothetical protein